MNKVASGIESLQSVRGLGGRACLVCNQASVDKRYRRTVDIIASMQRIDLRFLMGPEHGLYGVEQDMIGVDSSVDPVTGLPVLSLYGDGPEQLGPPAESLRECDLLFFDLQDVGSRYYTFFATLVYCMRVCARQGVKVVVLDRPNPINGTAIEGGGVGPGFGSFVGVHDMPVRHGMTVGEMAQMVKGETDIGCELLVVGADGWKRGMYFEATGLPWIAPSPNMPALSTALVYPGMCLVEGTNLSEGRGTTRPFELFGAPFIDPYKLCGLLTGYGLPGVVFRPEFFKPAFHKYCGKVCGGAQVHVTDRRTFRPYLTGMAVLHAVRELWPDCFRWRTEKYEFVSDRFAIDLLTGSELFRRSVESGKSIGFFKELSEQGSESFRTRRKGYLLYG